MRSSSSTASISARALVAHVRDVLAAVRRGRAAQLDQLLGRREERRRIDQRRTDAERARRHLVAHEAAHHVHLGRGRRTVVLPDGVDAQRRRADVRRDVLRDAASSRRGARYSASVRHVTSTGISRFAMPLLHPRAASPACSGPIELPSPKICSVTPCFSSPSERAVLQHADVRVAEHVDEAGRDGHPRRVDLGRRRARRRDAPIAAMLSPDTPTSADVRRAAAAVVDRRRCG